MKGTTIHLDTFAGRLAAARLRDGLLDDLLIAPDEGTPLLGAIYRATVDRVVKGHGGAMLRLPEGTAYLKGAKGLQPGDSLQVQVTGYAEPGKAVPVTDRPLFKSRFAIATPGKPGFNVSRQIRDDDLRDSLLELAHDTLGPPADVGLILRSAAAEGDPDEIAADIMAMTELAQQVAKDGTRDPQLLVDGTDPHTEAWREWPLPDALYTEPGTFRTNGIDEMIEALRSPRVDLPGDHWISVEPTRALVAVDVNTGADASLAAGLKANIATARALPAALRCRGLGGQIVIDMAPAPKKDRRQIEHALRAAFRADPVDTVLAGWTPLGHFELQRKRERLPLHQILEG
ncbi:ribonuclease E/G [Palleronia sp.]|uniref:ribonuclease E/G n=1 Tax=Palleronia sp. TaxID=1940284 RepID=UPI0035C7991A